MVFLAIKPRPSFPLFNEVWVLVSISELDLDFSTPEIRPRKNLGSPSLNRCYFEEKGKRNYNSDNPNQFC